MRRLAHSLSWYVVGATCVVLILATVGLVVAAHWPQAGGPLVAESPSATTMTVAPTASSSGASSTGAPSTTAASSTTSTPTTTTALSTTTTTAPPSTAVAPASTSTTAATTPTFGFDVDLAMSHIKALAKDIGARKSGTAAEDAAVGYAAEYLESLGYSVEIPEVPLPDGSVSHNVQAVKVGASASVIVVGGHIDSKAPAPGGNDNASGSAVVLELAHYLRNVDTVPTIEFVLFGAEEMVDSNADHHHYGSRQFVQSMTAEERSALVGMISVDMVAYGSTFTIRNMKRGPQRLTDMLLAYSSGNGFGAKFLKDTGTYGWSDHEPFELAGYPAAWVEWRSDPDYHTAADTYEHAKSALVKRTGEMLLGFLLGLTPADLDSLASARTL
jgi:aminopeptidase YwaD